MNNKFFTRDLGKYKTLVVNKETGRETVIVKDQKYREMEKRGDFLQPFGKDKQRFFDKNPQYKENYKGEIINEDLNYLKERELEESEFKEQEKEDFIKRREGFDKRFY